MANDKIRLDIYLVQQGLFDSREKAGRSIMAGDVLVNGRAQKASYCVKETDQVVVKRKERYISRGGYKLEKAMRVFPLKLEGKACIDVGSSTGGFTDCMLQNGARLVYCVDVGYGQLHYQLRQDSRVVVMERTNARLLTPEMFPELPQFASIDVSFISLRLIFPALMECMTQEGEICALIKPQFEAGREFVGKNGVVRDEKVHLQTVQNVIRTAEELGLYPCGLDYSPIKGPEGNIEYLLYVKKQSAPPIPSEMIEKIVGESHRNLK